MKFFLQDNTSDQIDEILKALNKLMDGDVSVQMKKKGLEYKLNYGASTLWLKQLAQKYKGNNELANRLWLREIRETMILATLIIEPVNNNISITNQWLEQIPTNEIAEQLGANTLWKVESIIPLSNKILKTKDTFQQASVWVGLATFLQKGNILEINDIKTFLDYIRSSTSEDSIFMQRVKGRFLRQLCRSSETNMKHTEDLINELEKTQNAKWLVEDVKTEIQFLKEK